MGVGGDRFGPPFEPGFDLRHELLLFFEFELPEEHPAAQKNEICVEHVAPSIVVDLLHFAGLIHVLHF